MIHSQRRNCWIVEARDDATGHRDWIALTQPVLTRTQAVLQAWRDPTRARVFRTARDLPGGELIFDNFKARVRTV